MANKKEKKIDWVFLIMGTLFLITWLIFFVGYFHYVSIGEWIAKENYTDKGEWFKQIGLFIATMAGLVWVLEGALDMFDLGFKKDGK